MFVISRYSIYYMCEFMADSTNCVLWCLPSSHYNKNYEIAAGYNIEMYSDPSGCKNGVLDDNYYSEVWITVKRK